MLKNGYTEIYIYQEVLAGLSSIFSLNECVTLFLYGKENVCLLLHFLFFVKFIIVKDLLFHENIQKWCNQVLLNRTRTLL